MRPLVDGGVLKEGIKLAVNAISSYSSGRKVLISIFEDKDAETEP